jgi:MSHA biogenesis protein MshP
MYPEPNLSRQQGAGLPIAIFIITVLALIVTSMAQQQESSGAAISQQVLSQRSFYAAESGAQAAVTEALHSSGCGSFPKSLSFDEAGLKNCSASLECSSVQADIDGDSNPETLFTLISEGQCGSGAEATSRTVEVRVR